MKLNNDDILDKSAFTNIKEQLFLDAYIDVDNTYFVGLIRQSSSNYSLHLSSRIGKTRVNIGGVNYLSLTDGGLNTLPYCETPIVSNNRNGQIAFSATLYKSAYNLDSTSIYLEYFSSTTYTWENLYSLGTLLKNTSANRGANVGSIYGYGAGDTVPIRARIQNTEGIYYSSQINLFIID